MLSRDNSLSEMVFSFVRRLDRAIPLCELDLSSFDYLSDNMKMQPKAASRFTDNRPNDTKRMSSIMREAGRASVERIIESYYGDYKKVILQDNGVCKFYYGMTGSRAFIIAE